ncbi:hypothetical protein PCIT_a3761 [Pseudoalteromonas citrea]|uniref:Uncharacterized protein n=1 Tax=Pseudoalteromonas citrea TaxID=43655 RepID=A0AAD4AG79_9GAMM|nr:hypothetical protein PCIT_a3761 [Pseudoalteromonas citrea]
MNLDWGCLMSAISTLTPMVRNIFGWISSSPRHLSAAFAEIHINTLTKIVNHFIFFPLKQSYIVWAS